MIAQVRYIVLDRRLVSSANTILREINFWDSRSAKSAILTHLEALNFEFHEFLHILKADIYQIGKILIS